MKTHCKRMLSLLLSLLLILPFVGLTAAGAEEPGYAAGDLIEYGSYPQSLVTDDRLLTVLPQLLGEVKAFDYYGSETGTGDQIGQYLPFTGMRYVDVVYQNVKYRGVTLDAYRPFTTVSGQEDGTQAMNGFLTGRTYWFRFEPLRWRVLDPQSGLVLCDTLIDCQPFAVFRDAVYAASAYTGEYGSTTDSSENPDGSAAASAAPRSRFPPVVPSCMARHSTKPRAVPASASGLRGGGVSARIRPP